MKSNNKLIPDVRRGGQAIPIGRNMFFMRGRKHSQGGIDVGKDLEVEDGEVMQVSPKEVKVFSSVPFLNGQSPAEKVLGGDNPNTVFKKQERFKKVNGLNDDGTKAEYGTTELPELVVTPNPLLYRRKYNTLLEAIDAGKRDNTLNYSKIIDEVSDAVTANRKAKENESPLVHYYDIHKANVAAADAQVRRTAFSDDKTLTGIVNATAPSQLFGATLDAIQDKNSFWGSLREGNSGFVSDDFYDRYPILSEGLNLVGDFASPFVGSKAVGVGSKLANRGANIVRRGVNKIAFNLNPNRTNINFIRNLGGVPEVDASGNFFLSPERNAFANFTWDEPFKTHSSYKSRPGTEYLVINPKSLAGERFLSTDPMDTFIPNRKLSAQDVTLISANPETRALAESRGFKTLTSKEIEDAYSKIPFDDDVSDGGRFSFNLNDPYRSIQMADYNTAVTKLIQDTYGKPNIFDALKLRFKTGINPHVKFSPNLEYHPSTGIEDRLAKKYNFNRHPKAKDLSTDRINEILDDLNSKRYFKFGGRHKAEFGIDKPINDYKIPNTDDKESVKWLADWLNNRRRQLYNNIKNSNVRYIQNRNTGEYSGESSMSLFNYLRGNNPNRVVTNKAFYTEIENAAGATNSSNKFGAKGGYNPNTREISVDDYNDVATRIHERTHAMHANYQERIIEDLMKNNNFKFTSSDNGGYDPRVINTDYWYNPREVYSRLMEYRYANKLNPNDVIDKTYINNNRNNLQKHDLDIIDDDTLIKLFNEVAQNNYNNDNKDNYITKLGGKYQKQFGGKAMNYTLTNNGRTRLMYVPPFTGSKTLFRLGGRKKALVGTKLKEREEFTYTPTKRRISTQKDRVRLTDPTVVTADGYKEPKFKIDNSIANINGDAWNDIIGIGANTVGSILSYNSNKQALDRMTYADAPTPRTATKLRTSVNINPQLDKVRESSAEYERGLTNNTASSRVADSRRVRNRMVNLGQINELYGNKYNKETELVNQDRLNQQSVANQNTTDYNAWREKKNLFDNSLIEKHSENTVGLFDNINAGIQDMITRREKRRSDENYYATLRATHPNVDERIFTDEGVRLRRRTSTRSKSNTRI